jgi:hypothetical protein
MENKDSGLTKDQTQRPLTPFQLASGTAGTQEWNDRVTAEVRSQNPIFAGTVPVAARRFQT